MPSRRILYVGHDLDLLMYLRRKLPDCRIVRSPGDSTVRILIASVNYSLFLCDEELPYTTCGELAEFNCSLERQPCTPFIIIKKADDFESIAQAIMEVFARA
jgi:hypothetical protein